MGNPRMIDLVSKAKTSRSAKEAIAKLRQLSSDARVLRERFASDGKLNQFLFDSRNDIQHDLVEATAIERQGYREAMEQERVKWEAQYEKDYDKNTFRIRNFERRLEALPDVEVQKMGLEVFAGQKVFDDPQELYALINESRARGLKNKDGVMADLIANKPGASIEPWRRTPVGQELSAAIGLCENVTGGFLAVDEAGRKMGIGLQNIFSELESEEAHDETDE